MPAFTLVSHHLCPYVQRVAIALAERDLTFERIWIDLADKPDWFVRLSPLGRVPLLQVDGAVIFESAVILEYLEETTRPGLHPADPLSRAEHRGWIEFGSTLLADIGGLYNAPDAAAFGARRTVIVDKLARLEARLGDGPWFDGQAFTLVDAVFAPVFRYFDAFDLLPDLKLIGQPKLTRWRRALAERRSVGAAVVPDFDRRLWAFLAARPSHLGRMVAAA
jgi:glutathione S-transferase